MFSTIRTLLCWLVVIGLASALERHLVCTIVADEVWQADVAPGWLQRYIADRTSLGRVLVLPTDQAAIPTPDAAGRYSAAAWRAFAGGQRNPVRNAIRLLGDPDTITPEPNGTSVRLVWTARLTGGRAAGSAADTLGVVLVTDGSTQAAWSYPPTPPMD